MSQPNKNLKKIQKEWYAKLKDQGFTDIERDENTLHSYSTVFTRQQNTVHNGGWEFKEAYYRMAAHFLNDHEFKTLRERVIWEYHAEGISCRNISKLLKDAKLSSTCYVTIFKVMKRLRQEMLCLYMPSYRKNCQ